MTNEEIEAARIEQCVPEGSVWMGDGWCLPETVSRLTDQVNAITEAAEKRKADPDKRNCYCTGVNISTLKDRDLRRWFWRNGADDDRFTIWHNPETGQCELHANPKTGGAA